jgi:hypothetical protein
MISLLITGMCDIVKHERQKLEVREATVHIMIPSTKDTKMVAYGAPALEVGGLTDQHYVDLTQEQHMVRDWNIILLAIRYGKLENDLEFEEVKKRTSKKYYFGQAFTPSKNVKFTMGGFEEDASTLDFKAHLEVLCTTETMHICLGMRGLLEYGY